ncbi:MAG: hypothetical protein WC732_09450 [Candidatus Omnitrophota bacterium]
MASKWGEFLSRLLVGEEKPVDPSVFGDPLALATAWVPLESGGSNFCSHGIRKIDSLRMEFKTTLGMKLFCSFFIFFGMAFAGIPLAALSHHKAFQAPLIWNALFGLIFSAIGIMAFYKAERPIVFDKTKGAFRKGRGKPGKDKGSFVVDLCRIRALQILSEHCRGNKSSYYSYELNAVLDDASRVNVVDHGSLEKLRKDAQILGQFLGVQIWDAELARREVKAVEAKIDRWPLPGER